jgi:hypothetical protein
MAVAVLLATAPAHAAVSTCAVSAKHRSKLRHCAPQICRSNTAALFGAVVWQATDGRPKRLSRAKVTSRERELMTTLQAVFLGMMLAWTPSVALLAFLLWQEGELV